MKKSEISIIAGLFIALAITFFTDTNFQADSIRKQTLRLHIIANDDSAHSQMVKNQVKDVISNTAESLYCRAGTYEDALQITQENLEYLKQITDNTLHNLGIEYTSQCSIEQFYFNTSQCADFTMPRGKYTALTIRLGEAKGKNWWCVVYPSLCTMPMEYAAAAASLTEEEFEFITGSENGCVVKFKLLELLEKLRNGLKRA